MESKIKRPEVTLLAIGGGGLNIAIDLVDSHVFRDYNIIVFDTDTQQFEKIKSQRDTLPIYCSYHKEYPKGLDNILAYSKELLDWEGKTNGIARTIIICSTLGGETGSQIAPLLALASLLQGRFVFSIFTIPAKFEGEIKLERALVSYKQLISISNISLDQENNLLSRYENLKLKDMNLPILQAFHKIYNQPLHKLSQTETCSRLNNLIPVEYQQKDGSLIKVFNNPFGKISFKNILAYFQVNE